MKHLLLCSAALLCASLAHAAPAPADNDRLDPVWDILAEAEAGLLTPPQAASLNNLAFQAAATRICQGRSLDHQRFAVEFDHVLLDTAKPLAEAQAEQRKAALLVAFGARYGIFLAEAERSSEKFCDAAAKLTQAGTSVPVVIR